MKLGSQEHDVDSPPGKSLNGSFRKKTSGLFQNDLDSLSGRSLDGSFRNSSPGMSTRSLSGISTSKSIPNSRRMFKALKDCGRKLVDLELFIQGLEEWVLENSHEDLHSKDRSFRSPFSIEELCTLDLALECVLFQQLFRMPCAIYASHDSEDDDSEDDKYLAVEDFLHTIVNGLWRTFWHKSGQLPFFLSCPRHPGSKFYSVEKAISRGRLEELCGLGLLAKTGNGMQVHWDQVVEFTLFRPDILSGNEVKLSSTSICEALFYGIHILIARNLSKFSAVVIDPVFILVFDSKFGAVVKLGGDISRLEVKSDNPYESVIEWIKCHAKVEVSSVDQVWNKLGNANWGDMGTLQVILATFYSMVQWNGLPRKSIASLASNHSLRLQKRRVECRLIENENALVPFQSTSHQEEIEEVGQSDEPSVRKQASRLKLRQGDILLLDDPKLGHKNFQIHDSSLRRSHFLYSAVSQESPLELLTLYVGAHPSRLEPCLEDMSLWYRVQRQTKVLNILKHQGSECKYLPKIVASGRVLHSGSCKKQCPGGRCNHPWCGTPILVTSPIGEPLSFTIARDGPLSSEEAIRCCRDCLTALRRAAAAGVQHGDFCPENIFRVIDTKGERNGFSYVPFSWGRAVLEDRDSPAINLQFSSSHALQNGKLCPSSDAESLIYILFFVSGGTMQQQDSIESALQWRETSWATRSIQQQLSNVSALLKAFADYVDSLCGTPYPVDYDIWLKRLDSAVDGTTDRGKMVEEVPTRLGIEDVAESSGTNS